MIAVADRRKDECGEMESSAGDRFGLLPLPLAAELG
jgi:hypothetical protein